MATRHLKQHIEQQLAQARAEIAEFDVGARLVRTRSLLDDVAARMALEEDLRCYELLVAHSRDIILFVRAEDGRIVGVNDAAIRAYGYTRDEMLALSLRDLRSADRKDDAPAHLAQASVDGVLFETVDRRKDGSTFPVEVSSRSADLDDTRILISIVRDITDRKQAEEALRKSEGYFRLTFDQAPMGAAIVDPDHRFRRVNEALCRFTGYSRDELMQRTFSEITHPDDLAANLGAVARLAAGQIKQYQRDKRYIRKDGQIIWGRVSVRGVHDADGRLAYFLPMVQDISERKRAEEALLKERAVLDGIMKATDVMLVYLDRDFNFVAVNRAYAEACRKRPEEFIGKNHFELYPHEENEAIFRQVRDTGVPVFFKDKPFVFPDQPERGVTYWDWSLTPITDATGSVAGLVFSLRETTKYKQAEEALRQSEQQLRQFIDSAAVPMAMFDKEVRYLAASRRWLADYGLTGQDIRGRSHYEVLPEVPERWKEVHRRCLAGAIERAEEDPFERADGTIQWLRWEVRPWYASTGEIGGLVMFAEDITDRRNVQQSLRESEAKFRIVADSAFDFELWVDPDGKCLYVSPSAQRITGYAAREFVDDPSLLLWLVYPEDRALMEEHLRKVEQDRGPGEIEYRVVSKDGSVRWLGHACQPVYIDGRYAGRRISNRDITDRKNAEQQLRDFTAMLELRVAERTAEAESRAKQLQRLAGELANTEQRERKRLAQILHDHLQQLLVGAKLSLGRARGFAPSGMVSDTVQEVDQLIDDALTTSRSLTAELSPRILHEGNMPDILRWLARWVQEKYGLSVRVRISPRADIEGAEIRIVLFAAVRELLLNTIKYSGVKEARIGMRACAGQRIQLIVADRGAGFDAESKGRQPSSSGLGLFSIQERLDLLGGKCHIASRPGSGTRVLMIVPRILRTETAELSHAAVPVAAASAGESAAHNGWSPEHPIRVLLADDHAMVRDGMASLLQLQPDIQVVAQASDGQQAIDMALQFRPDVVLMDVSMPRVGGIDATRRILHQMPDARIIGLSMFAQEDIAAQMTKAGAVNYLTKTAAPETLIAAIYQSVSRPANHAD